MLEMLRDTKVLLESLASTVPGVVYQRRVTSDGDIHYTYISDGAFDLFGVSPEEILADPQALFDCHGPEYRATFRDRLLNASRELTLWDVEAEIITRNGERKFTHAIARPLMQADGSVLWNGIILDATRMKEAERELRDSKERLESLASTVPGVVYQRRMTSDGDIHYTYISDGAFDLFGVSPEEILADPQALFDCHGPEYRATFRDRLLNASRELKLWDVEAEIITRNGERKFTHAIARPQRQADGSVLWNGIILDITRLKEAERELVQIQKMESLGTLAGGIAHEINMPMQYVGENLEFLKESFFTLSTALQSSKNSVADRPIRTTKDDRIPCVDLVTELDFLIAEMPKAIDQSLEGIERISTIVKAIKEFSYPEVKAKSAIDINQVISTTITIAQTQFKNVADLETKLDPTLRSVPCLPGDFSQVVLNLIVNAAHAIEEAGRNKRGRIVVTTQNLGEHAEIRIQDNGVGITRENLDKVFDSYFTTKEPGKGTGQGLAITHAIITKKLGGTISIASEPGKGTTFIIRLPFDGAISSDEAA